MAGKGRLKTAHQSEVKSLRGSNTDREHDVAVEGVFFVSFESACRVAQIMHESGCLSADL